MLLQSKWAISVQVSLLNSYRSGSIRLQSSDASLPPIIEIQSREPFIDLLTKGFLFLPFVVELVEILLGQDFGWKIISQDPNIGTIFSLLFFSQLLLLHLLVIRICWKNFLYVFYNKGWIFLLFGFILTETYCEMFARSERKCCD